MKRQKSIFTLVVLPLALAVAPVARAVDFDQTHAAFDRLLRQHVHDGWVNYTTLQADPKPLNAYLDSLAAVPEKEFTRWPEKQRLAFLINLYNATTLKLIVDNYPVKSIKKIGGFLSGPWKQKVVHLFGKLTTLGEVEHGIIRKQYPDPRAHFALVCAAKGCPPLRAQAYVASQLDEQLDDQGRIFLGQRQKNRVEAGARRIYLSPIFKWFSEDFEKKSGSVLKFVEPFLPEKDRGVLASGRLKIKYTDYDWSLNDQARR